MKIIRVGRCACALATAGLLIAPSVRAQTAPAIPQTVEDALHQMSDKAEVIFVGNVIAIRPHNLETMASGFVEIDFGVDQAIRGCTAGGNYTLREWAGLWAGNANRYKVGQHLLMMLHAPGPTGMSSPIGGIDGAIPILGGGAASLLSTAPTASQAPIVDLRRLGARLLHPVSYTLHAGMLPTLLTLSQQMSPVPVDELILDPIEAGTTNRGSVPVQQASIDTVVKLLTSWQKAPRYDVP